MSGRNFDRQSSTGPNNTSSKGTPAFYQPTGSSGSNKSNDSPDSNSSKEKSKKEDTTSTGSPVISQDNRSGSANSRPPDNYTSAVGTSDTYLEGQKILLDNLNCLVKQKVVCGNIEFYAIESENELTGYTGRCPRCSQAHVHFHNPRRGYYALAKEIHNKLYGEQVNNERAQGAKSVHDLQTGLEKALPLSKPVLGSNKGIEGDSNSCYMDSTIFCMFAYSGVFDTMLNKDISDKKVNDLQVLLRNNIVNVLRSDSGFVERDALYHLRVQLSKATGDKSFEKEEKDPSEFLRALENLFDYAPLKTIPPNQPPRPDKSNITANIMWEMFDANINKQRSTNIGRIFRNSLVEIPAKLATVPPFLILVAPRHSRTERSYPYIIPDRKITLDHQMIQLVCPNCKKINDDPNDANNFYSCYNCSSTNSSPSTETRVDSYCFRCVDKLHNEDERNKHNLRQVKNIVTLNLFAVLCIERCHYVAFVKCQKSGNAHEWLFFDSMSDRVGDSKNVPAVSGVPGFEQWILEAEKDDALFDDIDKRRKSGKPLAKEFKDDEMKKLRLFRDGAFFFYENPAADYH